MSVKESRQHVATEEEKALDVPVKISFNRKCVITGILASLTFTTTFASSIFSAAISATAAEFKTSQTVMVLGISLYVLGFALAPVIWGSLGETLGRRTPILTGYALFTLLQIPTALTHNLVGLLLSRFFAGCMGASPVVLVPATYADIWDPATRGIAGAIYSVACFLGPTLGPIVGAFTTESLGWRWTAWITMIISCPFGILAAFFVPETYAPVLRNEPRPPLKEYLTKYLVRPLQLIRHETVFNIMTIYCSLVYGLLYLTFYAVPYIFRTERGWGYTSSVLPFLAVLIGVIISSVSVSIFYRTWLAPRLAARGKVRPEDRLPPIMVGALVLPSGLFWLGWTSDVSWVAQVFSLCFVGSGIMLIFTGSLMYLVDLYLPVSASATAANTCLRSIVAAGLPLAAPSMYQHLGTPWATTLLGLLCVALMPAPFLFYRYGERLRMSSKYN